MKNLTILAAGAILAAPVCVVAQEEQTNAQQLVEESVRALNTLSDILEKVTPDTAAACAEELNAIAPKLIELRDVTNNLTAKDKAGLANNKEAEEKVTAAVMRMVTALQNLQNKFQNATPEEMAKLQIFIEVMQAIGN